MKTSTVKWFDAKKGYGFIHHPADGEDVFVHYSNIQSEDDFKTLKSDQRVRFEMNDGPKGLHALDVEPMHNEDSSQDPEEDVGITPADVDPTATVDPSPSGNESSSDSSW